MINHWWFHAKYNPPLCIVTAHHDVNLGGFIQNNLELDTGEDPAIIEIIGQSSRIMKPLHMFPL